MKESNTTVEIRSGMDRLVTKYYPEKGVIEILQKGIRTIIIVPVGTPVQVLHGKNLIQDT